MNMELRYPETRCSHAIVACALAAAGCVAAGPASAGGLMLYEVGTEDVGLASAGYTARAQDASTVFTNPAGMTRLEGTQTTLGLQALYGDIGFTIGQGTSPGLGGGSGGNPVGWFPGGGGYYSYSFSPDLKLGFAATGNFGLGLKYDDNWAGRYYVQNGTLLGVSFLPSIAYRVSPELSVGGSLNA
jgi:long-chain fatty acid transport protein